MGLDMYLRKHYYVKNWEHNPPEEQFAIDIKQGGKQSSIPTDKIVYIITEAMYWRKANAIHKWFVDNVQDGEDDCKEYYVDSAQLKQLLDLTTAVLADHSKAPELLPAQSGFFFGGTDYDKYYFDDLEYTKKELEQLLANDDNGEYYYNSSW
jgi:hypothetical protein